MLCLFVLQKDGSVRYLWNIVYIDLRKIDKNWLIHQIFTNMYVLSIPTGTVFSGGLLLTNYFKNWDYYKERDYKKWDYYK